MVEARAPRLVAIAIGLVLLSLLACTRTPPEPTPAVKIEPEPARVAVPPVVRAEKAAAERCIVPMPERAPPVARPASASECPTSPGSVSFGSGQLGFPEASGVKSITVELASSHEQTARGLMYRRAMDDTHGMLFDLRSRKQQTFWMQNTCIPLDMMFVEEDGTIVGVLEQVPVLNEDPRSVDCESRYVIEVNAGFARKNGIKPGQKVKLP